MNTVKNIFSLNGLFRRNMTNRRFRSKLFIVYALVAILPIAFLVYYSYETIKDQLIRQAVENVDASIDQINNNIENKLDMYAQNASLIYLDTQLRDYLMSHYEKGDIGKLDAYDYINQTLYKILAMNPNLKAITIYIDNLTLHSDGLFIKHMDELPEKMAQQSLRAEGYITHFYPGDGDERGKIFTLARSLNYLSLNYPYGILTMDISEREIYSLIEKEGKNKTVVVADQDGRIITSDQSMASVRNTAELLAGKSDSSLVIEKPLSNGWRTIVILPYKELLKEAWKASGKMLTISLACVFAAIILIYATSQLMTKRFEILLQQIRKVERGNFDLRFPPMGHDEVGQLSFALKKMASKIEELIQDVARKEVLKNEAEMSSLQAQITPHFLYNTLASISALAIKSNNEQVHLMADALARFYRISLNKGKKTITIGQEIKLTEHYISIQETRFQGLFRVYYDLDETLLKYTTLKLIVQPFIENCINHAIWDDDCGIAIIVKLHAEGEDVVFSVIDDGMGMTRASLERFRQASDKANGYGIYNVDKRIKLAYGEQYGVMVYSRLGIGTSVRIRIPKTFVFSPQ
ncbi:sensor histidine kinase [Paenibacillus glycanilyticus]|uniref:Two-component sensor histidine kinase n=1 Tax=Paenibacillus glycanilyticus TaxID=126569 RepID=A0ABQ6G9U1_9BACL|nr:sensor histidine kinase [Paenibacillus glycanilyticus]GLX66336.1 two-component sensor histidine kinase [Paenibacillus glycanilyticus]